MNPTTALLAALVLITIAFCAFWATAVRAQRAGGPASPGPVRAGIGFIANFFDTLGISSFATTTTMLRTTWVAASCDSSLINESRVARSPANASRQLSLDASGAVPASLEEAGAISDGGFMTARGCFS